MPGRAFDVALLRAAATQTEPEPNLAEELSAAASAQFPVKAKDLMPGLAGTALGASLQATLPAGTPANDEKLHAVAHDDQGSRQYMEDKWTIAPSLGAMFGVAEPEPTYFYGVYDCHTGKLAAEYVRTHLHANVARKAEAPCLRANISY